MGLNAGDVVNLTYQGTYGGQQIRYSLHWRVSVAGSSTTAELDLDAMAANFAATTNSLTASIQGAHVDTFNFDAVSAQRVFPVRTIRMNVLSSFPGALVTPGLPPNTSAVITKRTLTPGRMGLGSTHFTGVAISAVSSGIITSMGPWNAIASIMATARTIPAVSMTVEPGLFNPTRPPTFFSRLFDSITQDTIRVMRRRTVRLGI